MWSRIIARMRHCKASGGMTSTMIDLLEGYRRQLHRRAMADTRKIMKRAKKAGIPAGAELKVEVHGKERAEAWMEIGWHPEVESGTKYTLRIKRWD
jgi:hypothetical protein